MTSKIVDGSIAKLNHCQEALDWLWAKYFTPKPKPAKQQAESPVFWNTCSGDNLLEWARRYIATMPAAISGQGGHNQTYNVACVTFRFGLTEAQAHEVVSEYNSRSQPPWSDHELCHKLDDARKAVETAGEFGSMLQQSPTLPSISGATPVPSNKSAARELIPTPIPDALYHVPSFIADVMEYALATAPYPSKH